MRLAHSLPIALFVSMAALVSACGDEASDDDGSNTGGSGGTSTGGTAGAVTGGSGGSGAPTGGTGGSGAPTGGSGGAGAGGAAGAAGSGTTGGSGGSTGLNDHPTDSSQAGIEAWLMMNTYTQAGMGFRPESTPSTASSVHGAVLRYFNETVIASKAAMNSGNTHTVGSMAVKDIVTGTAVIGKAVMLRTDTGWIYYCKASEADRCFDNSVANAVTYQTTGGGSCACHGSGTINSSSAIPAP